MDLERLSLDPDDDRPRWQALSAVLKAAIRSSQLEPGAQLPTKAELGEHFGVSSTTVTKALDQLRSDGVVISRQGAGVFVREFRAASTELQPHVEELLAGERRLSVAFAGISAQTLHGALTQPLDRIRSGRYECESIDLRLLLPDLDRPWHMPSRIDGADVPQFRERVRRIVGAEALVDAVAELGDLGIVSKTSVEVRRFGGPPTVKTLLVNEDLFMGFYDVRRWDVPVPGLKKPVDMFDMMGKDTPLVHFTADAPGGPDVAMIDDARTWFDAVWSYASPEVPADESV